MLARDDEVAVGGPFRAIEQAEGLLGDRARVRAVPVHHPDVVAAAAIGGEGDLTPVGRIAGLHLPRVAGRDGMRLTAADRHHVNVAEHVERDLPAVRRNIEVHPRAFGDVDRDVVAGAVSRADVPLLVFAAAGGRACDARGLGLHHRLCGAGLPNRRCDWGSRRRLGVRAGRTQAGRCKQHDAQRH